MLQLNPYLCFDGTCAEAMQFYERALSAKLQGVMTFGQSPMRDQLPPGSENRIMHCQLLLPNPDLVIMASDSMPGMPYEAMKGFSLTLSYETAAEAQTAFAALSDGGTVRMAMHKTFWAEAFGMLVDRFGTPWTINGAMTTA